MKPIISVEGLGKSYTIRHEGQTHYKSLREEIFKLPSRLLRRGGQSREEFWALKDVSFDIMPGDRVGIIGRNGAGKSTLLKLLSRITEPTTGRITLRGRVASLLEVGTGFHPELTGRENIYLNGAILGMSRAEVRRKFDEIVDFAGVEKFLDTPVKRYSSGMYVRLAFAVAAHLEPEILIVDEVLAVGDAEFQRKCLGKMESVGKEGRTVLFVSHNMGAIAALCNRAMVLESGTIRSDNDSVESSLSFYNSNGAAHINIWKINSVRKSSDPIVPLQMAVVDENLIIKDIIFFQDKVYLKIKLLIIEKFNEVDLFYKLISSSGICLYNGNLREDSTALMVSPGVWDVITELPTQILSLGEYSIRLNATIRNVSWIFDDATGPIVTFVVKDNGKYPAYWALGKQCPLAFPNTAWDMRKVKELSDEISQRDAEYPN